MIYSSLDSSRQDESNDSKIIPIGAIFAEIAIFTKFQVGSGRVNCLTRPEFSGRVGSGTRISGQRCGALFLSSFCLNLLALTPPEGVNYFTEIFCAFSLHAEYEEEYIGPQ